MTSSTQASTPLATRINHFFQHRTERERIVFEEVRHTLSVPADRAPQALRHLATAGMPRTQQLVLGNL
jgi:hypothetical protein